MILTSQVALITGAGRGIGKAMALALARAGASVVLVSRTEQEIQSVAAEATTLGTRALPVVADVSRRQDVEKGVARSLEEFGQIHILVNSAGVYGPIGPLVNNDMDAWRNAIEINLMGTVFTLHTVLPHMIERRRGVVINLSGGGAVSAFPRFSAYSTSKAAVVRLTETIAEEVKEFGIRVNAVAPGAVNTRLLDRVLEAGEEAVGKDYYAKSLQQKQEGGTPPEKCAELAVFLASPQSAGLTGRLISAVWDDWKVLAGRTSQSLSSSMFTLRRIDGRNFIEIT